MHQLYGLFVGYPDEVNMDDYELPVITGTLKKYLHELVDPVIPENMYHQFIDTASECL